MHEIKGIGFLRYLVEGDLIKCCLMDVDKIVEVILVIVGDYNMFTIHADIPGKKIPVCCTEIYVQGMDKRGILVEELVRIIRFMANPAAYCK
jgi:hypothetical protein